MLSDVFQLCHLESPKGQTQKCNRRRWGDLGIRGAAGKVKRAADFSGCGGSSLHLLCSCLGSNPARARGQKRVCRMRWKRGVQ